jgi:ribonuclease Z
MIRIAFLGTGYARPGVLHDNTSMLIRGDTNCILVDCGGSPLAKVLRLGVTIDEIDYLFLTHRHLDHIYGLPSLLQSLWLAGRKRQLPIYGNLEVLDTVTQLLDVFEWKEWTDMFPVRFKEIGMSEGISVMSSPTLAVRASPARHAVPTNALRFDFPRLGKRLVYSSDTEPCAAVSALALDSDCLIHECSGGTQDYPATKIWHSSARDVGRLAMISKVRRLILVHYPPECDPDSMLDEAREQFSGDVQLANDMEMIDL